jgi:uncharacterized damage-inducible protein DinB
VAEHLTISPLGGFGPRIGSFLWQLDDVRKRTLEYVDGLSPEELAWTPDKKVESIGTQLFHIAAVERSWIGEDIDRRPMGEEWALAFPIRRRIEQIRDKPLDYFIDTLHVVRQETRIVLAHLTDGDLSRQITPLDQGDVGDSFSIEWILYHLVEHEAHHKGQIAVLKRLYRAAHGHAGA